MAAALVLSLPGAAAATAAPSPHTAATSAAAVAPHSVLADQQDLAGAFVPTAPTRLLDTRNGTGGHRGKVAQTPVQLDVSGVAGDRAVRPTAVVLNVTVTGATSASHLAVYPGDQQPPATSNLNFSAGQTVPNLVTVPVGGDGKVAFVNSFGSTDVLADLAGYYTVDHSGGSYVPVTPKRLLDTRNGTGTGGVKAAVGPGGTVSLPVAGTAPVPATGVSAVVLNVTVTAPTTSSFLTVYPHGGSVPNASNLNYVKGLTVSNLVTVRVGTGGRVDFRNTYGSTQVIADIAGYYLAGQPSAGSVFQRADAPTRVLDTRDGTGTGGSTAPVGANGTITLAPAGVPATGVTAVVLNVTVTNPTTSSYLTVYPHGGTLPTASNINFTKGQVVPNLVVVAVGSDGRIDLHNTFGTTHVVADLFGWFSGSGHLALTGLSFRHPGTDGIVSGVAMTWSAADTDPAATVVTGDLVMRRLDDATGAYVGQAVVVPFASDRTVSGGATLSSGGVSGATWTYSFILPKEGSFLPHWVVTTVSLREAATNTRLLLADGDLGGYDHDVQAQIEPLSGSLAPQNLTLASQAPGKLPYYYDGGLTHATYTFSVAQTAGLWRGELTLGGPGGELTSAFEMTTFAGQPTGPCVPGASGMLDCTVQAEIPAGSPEGVYHLNTLVLYDASGQPQGVASPAVQDIAVTADATMSASGFAAVGPNTWRAAATYPVTMKVTGASGVQAIYLSWTGQPGCTQVSTGPFDLGQDTYQVTASMPKSSSTPASCTLTGIAVLSADGRVALYGPDFGAPDPHVTAHAVADTTPPAITSASLWVPSYAQGHISVEGVYYYPVYSVAPITSYTSYLLDLSGNVLTTQKGGTSISGANNQMALGVDLPSTTPVGTYTVAFTLTDAGGLSTTYGTPSGLPMPGGPLTLHIT
ncbi:MAG: hypothetical protein HOY69_26415 [Streptomyces sp.]|nr:hypothetical protein [Streptomyces sp.]